MEITGTTISSNEGIIYIRYESDSGLQYSFNNADWNNIGENYPINIRNTDSSANILTVKFVNDLTITDTNAYFVCVSSFITFDGARTDASQGTVTVLDVYDYLGLIQNGTSSVNGCHTISIKNINMSGETNGLAADGGWLCQPYFGNNINSISGFNASTNCIIIDNCSNNCPVNNESCGGICGSNAGLNGTINVTNCVNNGYISSVNAGGLFGSNCASNSGVTTITDCTNTGVIYSSATSAGGICGYKAGFTNGSIIINNSTNSGILGATYCGGICGSNAGFTNGIITIDNCTNNGDIFNSYAGGICGSNAGDTNGTITITNCINTVNVSYNNAGGICGSNPGFGNGIITIDNCVNNGIISGSGAGGICGDHASGQMTITNCSNTGKVSGLRAGGITGDSFGYNTSQTYTIQNCYSTSDITGNNAGGICGAQVGYNFDTSAIPTINILNCYTLGNILTNCGGILGGTTDFVYKNIPIVTLTNCYSNGVITDADSGLISNNLPIKSSVIVTNCYVGNGSWSDTSAKESLIGVPTDVNTNNPASNWTSISTNSPYLLSTYNSELYNPKSMVVNTTSYSTSEGLFQPDYTYSIINVTNQSSAQISINATNGVLDFSNVSSDSSIVTNVISSKYDANNKMYNYNINTFTLTYSICFKEDSEILCLIDNKETYVKIQDMKPNMLVKTYNEGYVPIYSIGWFHLTNEVNEDGNRHPNGLFELTKEKYPQLTNNLVLTGRHSILVKDLNKEEIIDHSFHKNWKIQEHYKLPCFANKNAIQYQENGLFKIWSFCLKADDSSKNFGIYANGLLVESTNKQDIRGFDINYVKLVNQ